MANRNRGKGTRQPKYRAGNKSGVGQTGDAHRKPPSDLMAKDRLATGFPTSAGISFGLGIGGFFDGIVLHQILQWHHMATSAGVPADTVEGLKLNTLLDGLFHATTYMFVLVGLILLWRAARRAHLRWSTRLIAGSLLLGFGLFNCVEGVVDHHLLGLHHVNETVARAQWIYWDIGFLAWGAAMMIAGLLLLRRPKERTGAKPN